MDIRITFKKDGHLQSNKTYRNIEPKTLLIDRGIMYFAHDTGSPAQYKIRLTDTENITMTF